MKIEINRIKVKERIRREVSKIDELALNIVENGLLNPITVMELPHGEYQLLAGLRRLKAMEKLGYNEIDINVVSPADAEAMLKIEVSENEQREPFTFSEKMDFARVLEEIEQLKSKERMSLGGKGGLEQGAPLGAHLQRGETREIVAEKIGMGKTSYDRAKYIAKNAPDEVIAELDRGERSIRGTYEELRAKERYELPLVIQNVPNEISSITEGEENPCEDKSAAEGILIADKLLAITKNMRPPLKSSKNRPEDYLSQQDKEALLAIKEFAAMTLKEKVEELKRQLKVERARGTNAEVELAWLKELRKNEIYHKDGIINNLQMRLTDSEEELTKAMAQIQRCEKCKLQETQISAV